MKPSALAVSVGVVWGGVSLAVGLANIARPDYGGAFLQLMASLYPGYGAIPTPGQVAVLTGYALVDGALLAYVLGWLYAVLARRTP